jgi:hypothetical protein
MNAYRGSRRILPFILNLGTIRKSVVKSRPCRFTPGQGHRYPLNRKMRGPHSRSVRRIFNCNYLYLVPVNPTFNETLSVTVQWEAQKWKLLYTVNCELPQKRKAAANGPFSQAECTMSQPAVTAAPAAAVPKPHTKTRQAVYICS